MSTLDHNEASENYIEALNNEREDDCPGLLWICPECGWQGEKKPIDGCCPTCQSEEVYED